MCESSARGFNTSLQKNSRTLHKTFASALVKIEKQINQCFSTSTPTQNNPKLPKAKAMEVIFSKYFEESAAAASLQTVDNDSGFVSHYQESNGSSSTNETSGNTSGNTTANSELKSVYISEDALLEEPFNVQKDTNQTECVYEEFTHLYYLNSVIESSVPSPNKSKLSLDRSLSSESDTSIVLPIQSPITLCIKSVENNVNTNPEQMIDCITFQQPTSSISTTPKKTVENIIDPNLSPDLFSDEDISSQSLSTSFNNSANSSSTIAVQENYVQSADTELLKRLNKCMSGVLPPPCITVVNLSIDDMLESLEKNRNLLLLKDAGKEELGGEFNTELENTRKSNSILVNTNYTECRNVSWPKILQLRYHGLHHNRSRHSEEMETTSMRYGQRYVSGETQSTCTVFGTGAQSSPARRRQLNNKLRWGAKSPGRRLSHLARRRITFSSSNLLAGGGGGGGGGSANARLIMVDAKRFELLAAKKKSPRKKTPRKSPRKSPRKRMRTPSSSTKKMEFKVRKLNTVETDTGPSTSSTTLSARKTTKRALFQSPEKVLTHKVISKPSTTNSSLSPWKRRNTPKQALFAASPDKFSRHNQSPDSRKPLNSARKALFATTSPAKTKPSPAKSRKQLIDLKRKRRDSDEDDCHALLPRSVSLDMTSSSLGSRIEGVITGRVTGGLSRVKSDVGLTGGSVGLTELSAHHKKKLQWAVYEALRTQHIGIAHPQFKQFAATLARVTRRLLPPKDTTVGTSERMLRIARQHVHAVTRGRQLTEIVQQAVEKSRGRVTRVTGYVSKEEEENKEEDGSRKDEVARKVEDGSRKDENDTRKEEFTRKDKFTRKEVTRKDEITRIEEVTKKEEENSTKLFSQVFREQENCSNSSSQSYREQDYPKSSVVFSRENDSSNSFSLGFSREKDTSISSMGFSGYSREKDCSNSSSLGFSGSYKEKNCLKSSSLGFSGFSREKDCLKSSIGFPGSDKEKDCSSLRFSREKDYPKSSTVGFSGSYRERDQKSSLCAKDVCMKRTDFRKGGNKDISDADGKIAGNSGVVVGFSGSFSQPDLAVGVKKSKENVFQDCGNTLRKGPTSGNKMTVDGFNGDRQMIGSSLSRGDLIKSRLNKTDSKLERVKKAIHFGCDGS